MRAPPWQLFGIDFDAIVAMVTNHADGFEDRKVTLPELIAIMDRNWESREDIRQACINAPKYGNDDDYADFVARAAPPTVALSEVVVLEGAQTSVIVVAAGKVAVGSPVTACSGWPTDATIPA